MRAENISYCVVFYTNFGIIPWQACRCCRATFLRLALCTNFGIFLQRACADIAYLPSCIVGWRAFCSCVLVSGCVHLCLSYCFPFSADHMQNWRRWKWLGYIYAQTVFFILNLICFVQRTCRNCLWRTTVFYVKFSMFCAASMQKLWTVVFYIRFNMFCVTNMQKIVCGEQSYFILNLVCFVRRSHARW